MTGVIHSLELRLLDPAVRRAPGALASLLGPQFTEFGATGRRYGVGDVLEQLAGEREDIHFSILDFSVRELGPGLVLATYMLARSPLQQGEVVHSLRSSIWQQRPDGWRLLFHQGTPTTAA